jgi:hypothetical protein
MALVDAEMCLEEALKSLKDGASLVDKDPVNASTKLYEAAVKAAIALATYFDMKDIPGDVCNLPSEKLVNDAELLGVVERVAITAGERFRPSWDSAIALRALAREGRLNPEDVKARLAAIENIVLEAQNRITYSSMRNLIEGVKSEIVDFKGAIGKEIEGLSSRLLELQENVSTLNRDLYNLDKRVNLVIKVFWPLTVVVLIIAIVITRIFTH